MCFPPGCGSCVFLAALVAACAGGAEDSDVATASGTPIAAAEYEVTKVTDPGWIEGDVRLEIPSVVHDSLPPAAMNGGSESHALPEAVRRVVGTDDGLPQVVVHLLDIRRGRAFAPEAALAVLDQSEMQFRPRVQLVRSDTVLEIHNSDTVAHNVRAVLRETGETLFNVGMPRQHQRLRMTLRTPGTVSLSCDMRHGWMKATVVVMQHPYYALTDIRGGFRIEGVPPGRYRLRAWHDTFGERSMTVQVSAGHGTRADFQLALAS